jgi:hypothetical protein
MNKCDLESNVNSYIDKCSFNVTHYDICIILHILYKSNFRYIGKKHWEYLQELEWIEDVKANKLRNEIRTVISDLFVKRYLYWYNLTIEKKDINEEIHNKLMADKMLKIAYKLKKDKFISVVIKEAQSFFDIHNND